MDIKMRSLPNFVLTLSTSRETSGSVIPSKILAIVISVPTRRIGIPNPRLAA